MYKEVEAHKKDLRASHFYLGTNLGVNQSSSQVQYQTPTIMQTGDDGAAAAKMRQSNFAIGDAKKVGPISTTA